ncbi:DUF4926 domain-containing protein [Luteibacter yeojuensis]|uniref:DUF4926 domain-containing protein n=1 Tax=Luteibacter yeojuensis TaxID=345309 RepID=A0A0F3K623_9GAMM|nr:hypothetical protein VI08_18405 [Luteibacter yeojuensis]
MPIKLFDVVILTRDFDEHLLKKGAKGTVLDVYNDPITAYEVEFCDEVGRTIECIGIPADALQKIS